MAEQFANLFQTTLAAPLLAVAPATSEVIQLASATGAPTGPVFRLNLGGGELAKVTAVSGVKWTVERGAEGTTPVAHPVGQVVKQVVTAGALAASIQPGTVRALAQRDLPGLVAPEIVPANIANGKYNAFGSIHDCADGSLIILYREGPGASQLGEGTIVLRRSTDQGGTWSEPVTVHAAPGFDVRMTGSSGVTSTGRIVLLYVKASIGAGEWLGQYSIFSDNNGETWSEPVEIGHSTMTRFQPTGSVITVGHNELLAGWYGDEGTNYNTYVIKSTDNGATWGAPIRIATSLAKASGNEYNEADWTYLGAGYILCLVRSGAHAGQFQFLSKTNGETWESQGEASFPSLIGKPTLKAYLTDNGARCVAAYYISNAAAEHYYLQVSTALVTNIIKGVAEWGNAVAIKQAGNATGESGYAAVLHPLGRRKAFGWFFEEVTGKEAQISFFSAMLPSLDHIQTAAVRGATQGVPSGSGATVVKFSEEMWESKLNPIGAKSWKAGEATRLTCRENGIYFISAHMEFATGAAGLRSCYLRLNGVTPIAAVYEKVAEGIWRCSVSTVWNLKNGDYIEVVVAQESGAEINLVHTNEYSPWLRMAYLGAV